MTPTRPKLFVLGFPRSGTERIKTALGSLGFRLAEIAGPATAKLAENKVGDPDKMLQTLAHTTAERADGLYGAPLPFLSEALDGLFPGAKFILPVFDPAAWLTEHDGQFRARDTALTKWMFGADTFAGNENVWMKVVSERFDRIRAQFKDRPADLLELNLAAGDGWLELVSFLGRDHLPPLPEVAARPVNRTAPAAPAREVGIVTEAPRRAPRPPKGSEGRNHASSIVTGEDKALRKKTERVDTRGFAADADRPRRPPPGPAERPESGGKPAFRGKPERDGKPDFRGKPERGEKPAFRGKPDGDGKPAFRGKPSADSKPYQRPRPDGDGKPGYRGKPSGGAKPYPRARPEGAGSEGGDRPARPDRPPRPAGSGKPGGSGKPFGGPRTGGGKGPGGSNRTSGGGKSFGGDKPGARKPGPRRDS